MVTIEKVSSPKQLKAFLQMPWKIYKDFPNWVPPLLLDQKEYLNRKKNTFFQESEADLFLAFQNGEVVGRIAAIRYAKHLEVYQDGCGFWGFFECIDDATIANRLFECAQDWARERGLSKLRGPCSFTINDESGLLIDGHQYPPCVSMPYQPPYYQNLVESFGFEKSQDLLAYRITSDVPVPSIVQSAIKVVQKQKDLVVRQADFSRLDDEMEILQKLYDVAWRDNWGAVPVDLGELQREVKKLKMFLNPKLIYIAEYQGKPVGVSLAIPDLNQVLKMVNGRLFPFGLFKILLNKSRIDGLRVMITGVLKEYRRMGIDTLLFYKTFESAKELGYREGELSWVVESNEDVQKIIGRFGGKLYKRYRIYDKGLS